MDDLKLKNRNILIIGESKMTCAVIAGELDTDGASIHSLASKEEIHTLNHKIDCILTTRCNGDYKKLKVKIDYLKEKIPFVPVIIITSDVDSDAFIDIIETGASDYIPRSRMDLVTRSKVIGAIIRNEFFLSSMKDEYETAIKDTIATYNHEFNNSLAILSIAISAVKDKISGGDEIVKLKDAYDRLYQNIEDLNELKSFDRVLYAENSHILNISKESKDT